MKTGNMIKYILIGVANAAIIFLVLIFLRPLLHAGESTAQLVKDPSNWGFAVLGGVLSAWGMWRKNNKR